MSSNRSALRNHFEFTLYRIARTLARTAGPKTLAATGAALGGAYLKVGRRRREIIDFNLSLAYPEMAAEARARLGRNVSRHFGRVLLDALRLQNLSPEAFRREITVVGAEHLDDAVRLGRGVILLSAHIGSWEVAALETGLRLEGGFSVINRPLDNPMLETELGRLRSLYGNRPLGRDNIARSVLRHLGSDGGVGILIDQRTRPREGIEVPFFGHLASTHTILARFVRKTKAPVVPLWAFWEGPGAYTVRYEEPVIVDDLDGGQLDDLPLTTRFTEITEAVIRERPDQWLWFHDRWRDVRLNRSS